MGDVVLVALCLFGSVALVHLVTVLRFAPKRYDVRVYAATSFVFNVSPFALLLDQNCTSPCFQHSITLSVSSWIFFSMPLFALMVLGRLNVVVATKPTWGEKVLTAYFYLFYPVLVWGFAFAFGVHSIHVEPEGRTVRHSWLFGVIVTSAAVALLASDLCRGQAFRFTLSPGRRISPNDQEGDNSESKLCAFSQWVSLRVATSYEKTNHLNACVSLQFMHRAQMTAVRCDLHSHFDNSNG